MAAVGGCGRYGWWLVTAEREADVCRPQQCMLPVLETGWLRHNGGCSTGQEAPLLLLLTTVAGRRCGQGRVDGHENDLFEEDLLNVRTTSATAVSSTSDNHRHCRTHTPLNGGEPLL